MILDYYFHNTLKKYRILQVYWFNIIVGHLNLSWSWVNIFEKVDKQMDKIIWICFQKNFIFLLQVSRFDNIRFMVIEDARGVCATIIQWQNLICNPL